MAYSLFIWKSWRLATTAHTVVTTSTVHHSPLQPSIAGCLPSNVAVTFWLSNSLGPQKGFYEAGPASVSLPSYPTYNRLRPSFTCHSKVLSMSCLCHLNVLLRQLSAKYEFLRTSCKLHWWWCFVLWISPSTSVLTFGVVGWGCQNHASRRHLGFYSFLLQSLWPAVEHWKTNLRSPLCVGIVHLTWSRC